MTKVVVLSVEEWEAIKDKIDDFIDDAKDGAQRGQDPKYTCQMLMEDLQVFRERLEGGYL